MCGRICMDNSELAFCLATLPGVGEKSIGTILRQNAVRGVSGDAFTLATKQTLVESYGLKPPAAAAITAGLRTALESGCRELRRLRRLGVQIITLTDAVYPPSLSSFLGAPPPVLCAFGDLRLLHRPMMMAANSNSAPSTALAACDEAVAAGVSVGIAPVTGHNRPAYQRPALVALRADAGVVYVLDRGLIEALGDDLSRELFPAAGIWTGGFDPSRHLVMSSFGPRDHGIASNNRRRDEIIASLAALIVVGQVRPGGTMAGLCARARQAGKVVLDIGMQMSAEAEQAILALRTERG